MTTATKVDLRKELKHLYTASASEPVILDVPEMHFLMIDGQGDPNASEEFQDAIQALYGVSYTLKFMVKSGPEAIDYPVMPLEGLWWADDMTSFSRGDKSLWKWSTMIMQPRWVTLELVSEAHAQLVKKRIVPALGKMRFEGFHEGLSAQIMHAGSYSDEGPTITRLHDFIRGSGYELAGKHHEI